MKSANKISIIQSHPKTNSTKYIIKPAHTYRINDTGKKKKNQNDKKWRRVSVYGSKEKEVGDILCIFGAAG